MPPLSRNQNAAWTMMELLIAAAILVVLLAVAFPVHSVLRERGLNMQCIQRLKTTGTLVLTYAADHGGRVMAASNSNLPPKEQTWLKCLYHGGYLENLDTVICPGFYPHNSRTLGLKNLMGTAQAYAMRVWGYPDDFNRRLEPKPLSLIPQPSRFFLLADSYWKTHNGQGHIIQPEPGDQNQFIHLRHSGRANLFFADGSVRATTREEIREMSIEQAAFGNKLRIQYLCWPEASAN